jgi:hypothetical protein
LLVAVSAYNADAVGVFATAFLPPPKSRLSSILLLCSPSSNKFHRVSPIQLERGDGEGCSGGGGYMSLLAMRRRIHVIAIKARRMLWRRRRTYSMIL